MESHEILDGEVKSPILVLVSSNVVGYDEYGSTSYIMIFHEYIYRIPCFYDEITCT